MRARVDPLRPRGRIDVNRFDEMAELQRDWQPPVELQRSAPREVELTPSGKAILIMASVFLLGGVVLAYVMDREARREADRARLLRTEGVTTEGIVTRRWRTGDKDDTHKIAYQFDYAGRTYTGQADTPRRIWNGLDVGTPLDIRFAPGDPHTNHPAEWEMRQMPRWVPFLMPPLFGIMLLILLLVIGRQKNLLAEGRPVPGRVTKLTRTKGGKMIHYEFARADGSLQKGKGGTSRKVPEIGATICVIYDRDHPRRSGLYPMDLVRIPDAPRGPAYRNRRVY